jgi:pimeloyl-ACP methyl ester carboxylesterase
MAWWESVLPALRDLYVVRLDLLGHSRSAKPADGYAIAEPACKVGAVLDHLGVRRATLVGHSTGGMVATSLAEQRRDLVTALALIDTGPRTDALIGETLLTRLLSVPVVGPLLWRLRTDNAISGVVSTAFTCEVTDPRSDHRRRKGHHLPQLHRNIQDVTRVPEGTARPDRLAELGLPVLGIFGSRDRRWQPSSAQDYRRVPQVRIEILNGVGHSPMVEDPDTTAARLGAGHHITSIRDFPSLSRRRAVSTRGSLRWLADPMFGSRTPGPSRSIALAVGVGFPTMRATVADALMFGDWG